MNISIYPNPPASHKSCARPCPAALYNNLSAHCWLLFHTLSSHNVLFSVHRQWNKKRRWLITICVCNCQVTCSSRRQPVRNMKGAYHRTARWWWCWAKRAVILPIPRIVLLIHTVLPLFWRISIKINGNSHSELPPRRRLLWPQLVLTRVVLFPFCFCVLCYESSPFISRRLFFSWIVNNDHVLPLFNGDSSTAAARLGWDLGVNGWALATVLWLCYDVKDSVLLLLLLSSLFPTINQLTRSSSSRKGGIGGYVPSLLKYKMNSNRREK